MDTTISSVEIATSTGRPGQRVSARNAHEHFWPAVDLALTEWPHKDAMRSAVENCQLQARSFFFDLEVDSPTTYTVYIESQAGHSQPSGASQDRRLWLEIVAYDAAGNELYSEGVVPEGAIEDPPEARHPFMMRDYIVDENGKETHMFWNAAAEPKSATIPPATPATNAPGGHSVFRAYRILSNAATVKLVFTLKFRPMGVDVLQDLVQSGHLDPALIAQMPTLTALKREVARDPSTGQFGTVSDLTAPDCNQYICQLDPGSPDCQPPSVTPPAATGGGPAAPVIGAGAPATPAGGAPAMAPAQP